MKICTRCGEEKELTEFSSCHATPDKLQIHCKSCKNEYNRTRKASDMEYLIKVRAQTREINQLRRSSDAQYRQSENTRIRLHHKNRWDTDPIYRAKHKHVVMLRDRNLEEQFNALPLTEQLEVLDFYINCPKGYEVDHIYPVVRGGRHCRSNLRYLLMNVNRSKHDKIPLNTNVDGTIILWS